MSAGCWMPDGPLFALPGIPAPSIPDPASSWHNNCGAKLLSLKSIPNTIVQTMAAAAPYDDLPVELRQRFSCHRQTATPTSSGHIIYAFQPLVLGRRSKLFGRSNTNRLPSAVRTKYSDHRRPSMTSWGEWGERWRCSMIRGGIY